MKLAVEIEVPEPRDVHLDPAKTAIVVIDMENEFCAPAGKKFIGSPLWAPRLCLQHHRFKFRADPV